MVNRKRIEEIRSIIEDLRKAEAEGEIRPGLLCDARYALLEMLDEWKTKEE